MAQECSCCFEKKSPNQFKKFSTCRTKPCNTVCNFCWTQYLKTDFTENPTQTLACFSCNVPLDKNRILKLLVKSPDDREYYDYCLNRFIARHNGERECVFADCRSLQVQMVEVDGGRLSVCERCCRQACTSCGVPEHLGESCKQYQVRIAEDHAQEESATATAFAKGYSAQEEVGKEGRMRSRPKHPLPCPSCGIWIERFGGCLRMRCPVCSLDFCSSCAAPYLGKESVPLRGNAAHKTDCHYAKRKVEDRRFRPPPSTQETPHLKSEEHGSAGVEEQWSSQDSKGDSAIG